MTREDFAQDMRESLYKMKSVFFREYWSETCCMRKDEEQKLQNAIRKIMNVLDGMEEGREDEYS